MKTTLQAAARFQLEAETDGPPKRGRKRNTDTKPRGYAWAPGTGPAGETCGSCAHLTRRHVSRDYPKCALMRAQWTKGKGTDVKTRSPACREWAKKQAVNAAAAQ
jgi:hypothetical protein